LDEDHLITFGALAFAAQRGLACPSTAEILALMPHKKSDSAPPGVLARLERAKLIRRFIFQKGRAVEILANGTRTAMPANCTPHWRHRSRGNG
jgi:hypothetical protein